MTMREYFLLAIDDSSASQKAVEYACNLIAHVPDRYVHLVYVLPPSAQPEAIEKAKAAAQSVLDRERGRMRDAGFDDEHVDAGSLSMPPDASLVDGLIDVARDQNCGTIIVGRNSLPWYREMFHHHPADELVRRAHGFTLWVVE